MNELEICDTTLGLGIGVGIKRERQSKQNKRGVWLNLSLPLHPKIEASDHDHDHHDHFDNEKDDQDSFSSKTMEYDQEEQEERGIKRSASNTDVYNNNSDGSRKKLKLTTEQTTLLEDNFKINSTLNTGQKQELAKKLNLLPRQIEVWFQNRRARTKLKQIEQECALLKKCCESLNEENRRLKTELQEVRCYSIKLDHPPPLPFYIRLPTTTTTTGEMHHPCDKLLGQDTKTVIIPNGGSIAQILGNSNKKNASVKLQS